MTRGDIITNIIENHFGDNGYAEYRFMCKHWVRFSECLVNWSDSYFDKHIVSFVNSIINEG